MKPLAFSMRPDSYENIVGQDHLVGPDGVLTRMINNKSLFSFILYGNPGCGKTTIAEATCKMSGYKWFRFNASTDNKDTLKQIINESRFYTDSIIIVDEIHRMKKDIQDYLLPYVENGTVIMIGLTTVNPYHAVNPAIRSRCHVYRLHDLTNDDLKKVLVRAHSLLGSDIEIDEDVYDYLVKMANLEIRTLINSYETLIKTATSNHLTIDDAYKVIQKANVSMDANGDNYYDTLSGLHKSIRGSDVDAALHYLARLIVADDLQSLCRRLLCIAYEDIGLANPTIGPRVKAACDAARELGNPEAKLPLSVIVIEMALSPKSNTACMAVDEALQDVENGLSGSIPLHLKNTYSFNPDQTPYLYPHDYEGAWVNQQYMPDTLLGRKYYHPKPSSNIEIGLMERYQKIEKMKKEHPLPSVPKASTYKH